MGNFYSPDGNFEVWDEKPKGYYTEEEWARLNPEPTITIEELIEEAYESFDKNIENRLDKFAATRRYKSINSACSYAVSTDPQFRKEGEYCILVRDLTYRKCYELLEEYVPLVISGERDIPTWGEIVTKLPTLEWPN